MPRKTQFNIVEAMADDDEDEEQAFDQPCVYGNRLGGHSVYCHHPDGIARKCIYRWCTQAEHEANECGGYTSNPNYKPLPVDDYSDVDLDAVRVKLRNGLGATIREQLALNERTRSGPPRAP